MNVQSATRFLADVRAEARKITWPSVKDTRAMSIMVFILVVIVSSFLVFSDLAIGAALSSLLGLKF